MASAQLALLRRRPIPYFRFRTATPMRISAHAVSFLLTGSLLAADPSWEPSVYPDDQLYSSYIVSTATMCLPEDMQTSWDYPHLGDEQSMIGAYVDHLAKGSKVTVEVKKTPYIEGGRITVKVPKAGDWLIHPKVAYDYDALVKVHQPKPVNIRIEVSVDGESLGEQTQTATLHSINDCLFSIDDTDYSYLFAAYVNEDHPWVDQILREALDTGIVDAFDGYQSGERDEVLKQIYAIWDVMQRRGMKYSSITATSAPSESTMSQHVRLFDDAIRAKQANCVDGTCLLAAVLRKIGLNVYLVALPDHMYLAADLDESDTMKFGRDRIGLETTMMGAADEDAGDDSPVIPDIMRALWGNRTSWNSFEGAVDYATGELRGDWKKAKSGDDPGYQIIDVTKAREYGILPIASPGEGAIEAIKTATKTDE